MWFTLEENIFSRTEILFGKKNMELLKSSSIIIFGIGGVGSYACEALARSGIFNLTLVDFDRYSISNINRQIGADINTINKLKTLVTQERILKINPDANINIINKFIDEQNIYEILDPDKNKNQKYNYIIDAIDTIKSKIQIILAAKKLNIPIISSMGMGNKFNPMLITLDDIYKTKYCPLAKIMRHELKKHNIKKLRVCYSTEQPKKILDNKINSDINFSSSPYKKIIGSVSFVPSVAGLIITYDIIKNILGLN